MDTIYTIHTAWDTSNIIFWNTPTARGVIHTITKLYAKQIRHKISQIFYSKENLALIFYKLFSLYFLQLILNSNFPSQNYHQNDKR